ncbi:MAG: cbb3-type cytochrome c oxidase subunit I [Gammaproteobacteria bacterium]|nr:cbb3-type cytochrome c oxidase subunit I [Gammaproteobacteria bacterium]
MSRALDDLVPPVIGVDPLPTLVMPQPDLGRLARGWLWLGLLALAGSGVFAVLLVLSRTPQLNQWLPVADFFRVALIVHVDLSVLVWFVALAGLLWSISGSTRAPALAWLALGLCSAGTVLMAVAPFMARAAPIMANYIPVLDGGVFLGGLALFGLGSAVLVLRGLIATRPIGPGLAEEGALRFGFNASLVAAAVALLSFGASLLLVPRSLAAETYYEILFWGGGHALQFVWTLLMLVGWLWLAGASGARVSLSPRVTVLLLVLALASVFATPFAYLVASVTSVEFRVINTWGMRLGGGVAIVPIGLAVVHGLLRTRGQRSATELPLRAALVTSVVLFGAGGVIGVLISGSNVRIPAHYHGCIVGVTLALMGLVYLLLPRLGYRPVSGRLACWQPVVYGAGQLLHIIGLVWSGGYGVQRKVAGAEQVLRSASEVAGMGLMGLGGLVAIIGGLLFVVVVVRSMRGAAA